MKPAALLLFVFATAANAASERDSTKKLVVLPIVANRVDNEIGKVLDEILMTELSKLGTYRLIGASDLDAMLNLERIKDVAGCDNVACAAEIGGAVGAQLLFSTHIGALGDQIVLSAKLIDIEGATVISRQSLEIPKNEKHYSEGIRQLVAAVFGATPQVPIAKPFLKAAEISALNDSVQYERFVAAGLSRLNYLDFVSSGLSYPVWANRYNSDSESLFLEISKWVCTGTVAIILAALGASNDRGFGTAVAVSTPMLVSTIALWGIDIVNIGNAPEELPELTR